MTTQNSTLRAVDKQALRNVTMACWWPSPVYHPNRPTDWQGIRGELAALMDGAFTRGEMTDDMAEFNELARLYDIAGTQS